MACIEARGLRKAYGATVALDGVDLRVETGRILGLIGPNGAGKTTCFNIIAGVFPPDSGEVRFGGERIDGRRPDQICKAGIGRTFQLVKPFVGLSVMDNVVIGALNACRTVREARDRARQMIDMLGLSGKRAAPASALTLPERRRLEVARALATKPRILLLDEVMAGLRPTETDQMVSLFRKLNADTGLTILLIEHVMRAVMALSRRVVVLHHGQVIADGSPEQVTRDPAVLECYLGEEVL
jgi:branched-chain amino acid transport system ATP-binding protein